MTCLGGGISISGLESSPEKEIATHSSILAWKILVTYSLSYLLVPRPTFTVSAGQLLGMEHLSASLLDNGLLLLLILNKTTTSINFPNSILVNIANGYYISLIDIQIML